MSDVSAFIRTQQSLVVNVPTEIYPLGADANDIEVAHSILEDYAEANGINMGYASWYRVKVDGDAVQFVIELPPTDSPLAGR